MAAPKVEEYPGHSGGCMSGVGRLHRFDRNALRLGRYWNKVSCILQQLISSVCLRLYVHIGAPEGQIAQLLASKFSSGDAQSRSAQAQQTRSCSDDYTYLTNDSHVLYGVGWGLQLTIDISCRLAGLERGCMCRCRLTRYLP